MTTDETGGTDWRALKLPHMMVAAATPVYWVRARHMDGEAPAGPDALRLHAAEAAAFAYPDLDMRAPSHAVRVLCGDQAARTDGVFMYGLAEPSAMQGAPLGRYCPACLAVLAYVARASDIRGGAAVRVPPVAAHVRVWRELPPDQLKPNFARAEEALARVHDAVDDVRGVLDPGESLGPRTAEALDALLAYIRAERGAE